jgi:hypothetical protein
MLCGDVARGGVLPVSRNGFAATSLTSVRPWQTSRPATKGCFSALSSARPIWCSSVPAWPRRRRPRPPFGLTPTAPSHRVVDLLRRCRPRRGCSSRSLLRFLEQAQGPAADYHALRLARLGLPVLIDEAWYKRGLQQIDMSVGEIVDTACDLQLAGG